MQTCMPLFLYASILPGSMFPHSFSVLLPISFSFQSAGWFPEYAPAKRKTTVRPFSLPAAIYSALRSYANILSGFKPYSEYVPNKIRFSKSGEAILLRF